LNGVIFWSVRRYIQGRHDVDERSNTIPHLICSVFAPGLDTGIANTWSQTNAVIVRLCGQCACNLPQQIDAVGVIHTTRIRRHSRLHLVGEGASQIDVCTGVINGCSGIGLSDEQ
jgi:hypothetical protein